MDAKERIRVAVAGQGEQAGWNSLAAQYQPMMRAIAHVHHPTDPLDQDRPIARRRSWLPFDWYGRRGIKRRINTECRRPTTAKAVAICTGFDHQQRDPIMTAKPQPHRTRGYRPGYRPTPLADITIRIHAKPNVDAEVWRALHTDVNAAIDSSLKNTDSRACVPQWPPKAESLPGIGEYFLRSIPS
jgi:hypothetical protein